jgi:hypothetical protein
MTGHDHEMLAILHGSHDVDMQWGAWMTEACEWLKANGYAKGHYEITDKGRAYMEANPFVISAAGE